MTHWLQQMIQTPSNRSNFRNERLRFRWRRGRRWSDEHDWQNETNNVHDSLHKQKGQLNGDQDEDGFAGVIGLGVNLDEWVIGRNIWWQFDVHFGNSEKCNTHEHVGNDKQHDANQVANRITDQHCSVSVFRCGDPRWAENQCHDDVKYCPYWCIAEIGNTCCCNHEQTCYKTQNHQRAKPRIDVVTSSIILLVVFFSSHHLQIPKKDLFFSL